MLSMEAQTWLSHQKQGFASRDWFAILIMLWHSQHLVKLRESLRCDFIQKKFTVTSKRKHAPYTWAYTWLWYSREHWKSIRLPCILKNYAKGVPSGFLIKCLYVMIWEWGQVGKSSDKSSWAAYMNLESLFYHNITVPERAEQSVRAFSWEYLCLTHDLSWFDVAEYSSTGGCSVFENRKEYLVWMEKALITLVR